RRQEAGRRLQADEDEAPDDDDGERRGDKPDEARMPGRCWVVEPRLDLTLQRRRVVGLAHRVAQPFANLCLIHRPTPPAPGAVSACAGTRSRRWRAARASSQPPAGTFRNGATP